MESLMHIRTLAADILGGEEEADAWLNEKNTMLNNLTPFELLDTDSGALTVHNLLGHIAHGILS